jgi:alkaline phosphatase D
MTIDRRRILVGGAGLAALLPAACSTAANPAFAPPKYDGAVAFRHGVASGDPGLDRVIIWTRVTAERQDAVPVRWIIASDDAFETVVASGNFTTNADRDWTVKVDVPGLSAARTYFYKFLAGDQKSPIGRTRTLPAGALDKVRLVAVSCSSMSWGFFNAYKAISKLDDIDAVLHLGDYIYEYGVGGYGTEVGTKLGRAPEPVTEIKTLGDYRTRYAQYRTDPDLQAAHASAPFINVWDDHETANDSWVDGAENHDASEGPWKTRTAAALQAYFEWVPIRDPAAGKPREAIYRSFQYGDLLTLIMAETRLTARSQQLDYAKDLTPRVSAWDFTDPANPKPAQPGQIGTSSAIRVLPIVFDVRSGTPVPIMDGKLAAAIDPRNPPPGMMVLPDTEAMMARINDPARQMMGPAEEAWLFNELANSTSRKTRWQVLGNQVLFGRIKAPDLVKLIPGDKRREIEARVPEAKGFFELSQLGLPMNIDAWDGYPAARARVYSLAQQANARLVVLTGDTHSAWANELMTDDGRSRVGVEFGVTSITSPGITYYLGEDDPRISPAFVAANPELKWCDLSSHGFTLVEFSNDSVKAEFHRVSTILSTDFAVDVEKTLTVARGEATIGAIEGV